jgi:hypothetical protein
MLENTGKTILFTEEKIHLFDYQTISGAAAAYGPAFLGSWGHEPAVKAVQSSGMDHLMPLPGDKIADSR